MNRTDHSKSVAEPLHQHLQKNYFQLLTSGEGWLGTWQAAGGRWAGVGGSGIEGQGSSVGYFQKRSVPLRRRARARRQLLLLSG